MICPKCGAFVQDGSSFCNHCGVKLNKKPTAEDIPDIMTRPRDEKFDFHREEEPEKPPEKPDPEPEQNKWVILCIFLCGAVLAAVAVLLFYSIKNNQRVIVTPTTASESATTQAAKVTEAVSQAETQAVVTEESVEETPTVSESQGETTTEAPYEDMEQDGILYRVYEFYAVVLKSYSEDRILTVPAEVYGRPVTIVASNAFTESTRVQYITLPEGLQIILGKSFSNCPALKEVFIPDSVISIQDDSFEDSQVTIICHKDSYAMRYAERTGTAWTEGNGTSEQY